MINKNFHSYAQQWNDKDSKVVYTTQIVFFWKWVWWTMLSERLSTQPTKDTTVSDSFFLSMNQNQIRSTSVSGFSSHIGLSHRMFHFRIRCRGKQRPPKSEMLTTSNWRMHWQSGVRVNIVQEVHHPMHNTSKEATNQHEKNNVVFTLDFPNDN